MFLFTAAAAAAAAAALFMTIGLDLQLTMLTFGLLNCSIAKGLDVQLKSAGYR